jgi:hypothetical protein
MNEVPLRFVANGITIIVAAAFAVAALLCAGLARMGGRRGETRCLVLMT